MFSSIVERFSLRFVFFFVDFLIGRLVFNFKNTLHWCYSLGFCWKLHVGMSKNSSIFDICFCITLDISCGFIVLIGHFFVCVIVTIIFLELVTVNNNEKKKQKRKKFCNFVAWILNFVIFICSKQIHSDWFLQILCSENEINWNWDINWPLLASNQMWP